MTCFKPLLLCAAALAMSAGALLSAQSDTPADPDAPQARVRIVPAPVDPTDLPPGHVKTLPSPVNRSPFDLNSTAPNADHSIQVLSQEQMSASDRDLVANWESAIQERAGFAGLEFNGSGWTYRELVCPALPNHLFLRFTRNDGTREMTMFSAAVPRDGNGRVHIIPVVRKGYSLFSPAPIAALTMAAFNKIREEEGPGASADWLGTGLCYAALAGANPQPASINAGADVPAGASAAMPPTLLVSNNGGAVIRFVDVSTERPMEWNMTFDGKGKLVKATHTPASNMRQPVPMPSVDQSKITRTVPQQ